MCKSPSFLYVTLLALPTVLSQTGCHLTTAFQITNCRKFTTRLKPIPQTDSSQIGGDYLDTLSEPKRVTWNDYEKQAHLSEKKAELKVKLNEVNGKTCYNELSHHASFFHVYYIAIH